MKYGSFKYGTWNIGDEVQTLAAEQHLPPVEQRFNRDTLRYAEAAEPHLTIMQGWFAQVPYASFPPSQAILPVFYGFHISIKKSTHRHTFMSPEAVAYFNKHAPIGCRDRYTAEMLQKVGVDAFYSKCLTLTFPKRKTTPKHPKIFLVDAPEFILPKSMRKEVIEIEHRFDLNLEDEEKRQIAGRILEMYREEAGLVITGRLHCALPCTAMGIPVIYVGDRKSYRTSILKDVGVHIYHLDVPVPNFLRGIRKFLKVKINPLYTFLQQTWWLFYRSQVNWNPEPVDVEPEKARMIARLQELIKAKKTAK